MMAMLVMAMHGSPSTDRNLRRKYAAQIAGNGVSGIQISKIFQTCPRTPLVMRGLGATISFGFGSAPEKCTPTSSPVTFSQGFSLAKYLICSLIV
jgi:hypothetical protein